MTCRDCHAPSDITAIGHCPTCRQSATIALQQALERWPSLRLGQLLVNAVAGDPFYMSDYELAKRLKEFK